MEKGFLSGSVVKNPPASAGDASSIPGSGRSPGKGSSTPIFLSGKSHGQRSLEGYSPWGHRIGQDLGTNQPSAEKSNMGEEG